jgi:acyl carrier protein
VLIMVGILNATGPEPLTREDIAIRVKRVIGEHLDNPPEAITDADELVDGLGADSLDMVEIVMALELEFGSIEISDRALDAVTTVADAIDMVVATLVAAGRDVAAGSA